MTITAGPTAGAVITARLTNVDVPVMPVYRIYAFQPGVAPEGGVPADPGTFPAQTDVRAGVQYGPGDTDLTGNVTLPAAADVKKDVQYGANGTERTGELIGGGGRRRMIVIRGGR